MGIVSSEKRHLAKTEKRERAGAQAELIHGGSRAAFSYTRGIDDLWFINSKKTASAPLVTASSSLGRGQACEVVKRFLEGVHGAGLGRGAIGLPFDAFLMPQCFWNVRRAHRIRGECKVGNL